MIPIPKYLEKIVKINKNTEDNLDLEVICTCGCNRFKVYKNIKKKSSEEKEYDEQFNSFMHKHRFSAFFSQNYEADENNEVCLVIRRFFDKGKIIDKFRIKSFDSTTIIKVKCDKCQKEFVVFDSRFNGYNASIPERDSKYDNIEYKYKQLKFKSNNNSMYINIGIKNDATYEQFVENGFETTYEIYSNSFEWIIIKGKCCDNSKLVRKILDYETS